VFSAIAINGHRQAFEELPIPVFELSNNVILFDKDDRGRELFIEIKKCSHEIPFGRIHAEFKCLKPSEWAQVLTPRKLNEIED
ncbi:MAG: hypothetical protein U1E10_19600, partial [Bdellovibrionales bacterium]|nr:hypothetical protein [Bdellovibrionales bacterium]